MNSKSTEYMKEYNKNYYSMNRDKLKAKAIEPIQCDICKCELTRSNLNRHTKSTIHQKNAQILKLENDLKNIV